MYLQDPNTNEKSVPLTAFVSGFVVCLLKLVFSGIALGSLKLSVFSGGDFAAAVGALGTIYALHSHVVSLANTANNKQP